MDLHPRNRDRPPFEELGGEIMAQPEADALDHSTHESLG
jgi:hypothetical protein